MVLVANPTYFTLLSMNHPEKSDDAKQPPRLVVSSESAPVSSRLSLSTTVEKKREGRRDSAASSQQQNQLEKSLGSDYVLSTFDVICAKGKEAREHTGNRRFRLLVDMNLERYRAAKSKIAKSSIVTDIVDAIRTSSPGGGFIKMSEGIWYQVSEHHAREKVGQSFRDRLHTEYKSSSKAKIKRRKMNEDDFKFPPSSSVTTAPAPTAAKSSNHTNTGNAKDGTNSCSGDEEVPRGMEDYKIAKAQKTWQHLQGIIAGASDEIMNTTFKERNAQQAAFVPPVNTCWTTRAAPINTSSNVGMAQPGPWANRWMNLPSPFQLSMSSAILGANTHPLNHHPQSNMAIPPRRDLALERLNIHRYGVPNRPEDFRGHHQFGMNTRASGDQHLASLLDLKNNIADRQRAINEEQASNRSPYKIHDHHDERSLRRIRTLYQDSRRSRSEGSVQTAHEPLQDHSILLAGASRSPFFHHSSGGGVNGSHTGEVVDLGGFSPHRDHSSSPFKIGEEPEIRELHPQTRVIRRHSLGTTFDESEDSNDMFPRGGQFPRQEQDEEPSSNSAFRERGRDEEGGQSRRTSVLERESASRDLLSFSQGVSRSSSFSREFMDDQNTHLGRRESS